MPSQNMILDALNASAGAQNAAKKQQDTLTRILTNMGVLSSSEQEAITAAATASSAVEQQTLKGAQEAQDAAKLFARTAGTDITSPENILISLGQQLRASVETANTARQRLEAKQSMNPFDNPVGWLHGQLTAEQDYEEYQRASGAAASISRDISKVTTATDEVGRTQAALATKITDASRASVAAAREAEAKQAKIAASRNFLKDEASVVNAIQNASAAQAQEVQRQLGVITSVEQQALEQERFAMYKQQFDWEKEAKQLALKPKQDAESVKQQLLLQYNLGAQTLGLPQETNIDLVLARAELGGTDATRISAVMEAGGNTLAAGGSSRVANTPGGAATMIAKGVYPKANDPEFSSMRQYLKDVAAAKAAIGGKPEEVVGNINAQVKADAEAFSKNAVTAGSFYAPPPLQSLLATASVKKTPLYQKVLSTAGKDLTTAAPTPVIKLAYAAAKQGVISYEDAAKGLNELYGQAVVINNYQKRFAQIGVPSQKNFKVSPDIPGTNVSVDLTDYSSTLHLFALLQARERTALMSSAMLKTPFSAVLAPVAATAKETLSEVLKP